MIISVTQVTFIANSVSGHRNVVRRKNRKSKNWSKFFGINSHHDNLILAVVSPEGIPATEISKLNSVKKHEIEFSYKHHEEF